ncbi:MAG: radical SAM protein [Candidatus Paceibacterota bacterium]
MKIIKKDAKSIFTKTRLPGADFVINQYVGCEHDCKYCYAKFISRWKDYGEWGTWVEVKKNAPDLVKGNYVKGEVFMSSISDAYQPIEKELKLTRRILENLDKRTRLSILTKSDLILRDMDLFKKFKEISIGLTINGFEGRVKKILEPNSPIHEQRLNALETLNKNRIDNYAFVSPIIPDLTDVKKIIKEIKGFTDYFWFEVLNLRGAGEKFSNLLKKDFPNSYSIMTDKRKFIAFVGELKEIIKSEEIKTAGIEIHFPA